MSDFEAMDFFLAAAHGKPLASDLPALIPGPGEPADPSAAVTVLSADRERLRQAFFTLYDAAYPDEVLPTEKEMLMMMAEPPGPSISEIIAEFERNHEAGK